MLFLSLFILNMGFASENLKDLLGAKNLRDIRTWSLSTRELEVLNSSCQLELKSTDVPMHCYEYLVKISSQDKNKWANLDILCGDRIQSLTSPIYELKYVSEICKKLIQARNQEIRYISKDENPTDFVFPANQP